MSDTYCQIFAAEPKTVRANALEKYNFACGCEACREDWPGLAKLRSKLSGMPAGNYLSDPSKAKLSAVKTLEAAAARAKKGRDREKVLKAEVALMRELQPLLRPLLNLQIGNRCNGSAQSSALLAFYARFMLATHPQNQTKHFHRNHQPYLIWRKHK